MNDTKIALTQVSWGSMRINESPVKGMCTLNHISNSSLHQNSCGVCSITESELAIKLKVELLPRITRPWFHPQNSKKEKKKA